ncbi:MAG TPA: hypothetical protein VFN22_03195 [Gemmatimonadales bacterium]|nr:hypothetical protein [Gemmatimonadales bacterium]
MRRALGRALATTAVLSQLFALLVAPLGDLRHQVDHQATVATSGLGAGTAGAVTTPDAPLRHHDAATCPACIAQSIVAHHASSVTSVFVASTVSHLDPLERVLAPRPGPGALLRSRGPPLRS